MKLSPLWIRTIPSLVLVLAVLGCTSGTSQPSAPDKSDKEARIKKALDQLDPAERRLAEEQKYCAVQTENRLGSMGKPYKVVLEGQTVLLCCEHCEKAARKDPEKTLARVKELKEANRKGTQMKD